MAANLPGRVQIAGVARSYRELCPADQTLK